MAWPWLRNWTPSPPHWVAFWNGSETAEETVLGRQPMTLLIHSHLLAASWRGMVMTNRRETTTVMAPAVERSRKPRPRVIRAIPTKTRPEPQMWPK